MAPTRHLLRILKTCSRRAVVLRVDLDSEKPAAKLLCCYERRAGTGKRIKQRISAERSVAALGCLKETPNNVAGGGGLAAEA